MTRYWGQIAVALAAALAAGLYLLDRGRAAATALLVGLVAYIGVRWLFAWLFRIKYWHSHDGNRRQNCPDCGQYIYRKRGDWVLKCHRCGWTRGLPGLRLLLYSVPAQQLKRTVAGPWLLVVVLAVALVGSGVAGQVAVSDISLPEPDNDSSQSGPNTTSEAVADNTDGTGQTNDENGEPADSTNEGRSDGLDDTDSQSGVVDDINKSRVRQEFLALLNDERRSRGLQTLSLRAELTAMGREHSQVMAREGEIGHVEPDGDTIEDRYRSRGLLPECRLPIANSDRFYPGAENAVQTWVNRDVIQGDDVISIENEADLAQNIFTIWMNSELHRKAMLVYSADQMGLGLAITDAGKVYGSLELC